MLIATSSRMSRAMWEALSRAPFHTSTPSIRAMRQRRPSVPTRMRCRDHRSSTRETNGPSRQKGSSVMASTMAMDHASGCCSGDNRT